MGVAVFSLVALPCPDPWPDIPTNLRPTPKKMARPQKSYTLDKKDVAALACYKITVRMDLEHFWICGKKDVMEPLFGKQGQCVPWANYGGFKPAFDELVGRIKNAENLCKKAEANTS